SLRSLAGFPLRSLTRSRNAQRSRSSGEIPYGQNSRSHSRSVPATYLRQPMEVHSVEVIKSEYITPDVKRFVTTKPKGLKFEPGQGCMLAIDQEVWRTMWRAFTFTSLPGQRTLEFIVKIYPRGGVTQQMSLLRKGDKLLLK